MSNTMISLRESVDVSHLDITKIEKFLLANGWSHKQDLARGAAALWSKDDHLVVLPLRSTLADYSHRISEFIGDVAEQKECSEMDVFREIIR